MKEFDYIINGGGCAGLSLAYELNIHSELSNKTLAIITSLLVIFVAIRVGFRLLP